VEGDRRGNRDRRRAAVDLLLHTYTKTLKETGRRPVYAATALAFPTAFMLVFGAVLAPTDESVAQPELQSSGFAADIASDLADRPPFTTPTADDAHGPAGDAKDAPLLATTSGTLGGPNGE
jgi:hypothetical protein